MTSFNNKVFVFFTSRKRSKESDRLPIKESDRKTKRQWSSKASACQESQPTAELTEEASSIQTTEPAEEASSKAILPMSN